MPKPSLLVADADPRSLRIAEVALRRAGFAVATAVDGAEALRRIQRAGPDLVLADLNLPTQDGVALCRAVRGDPRLGGLPFLLMSGDRNPQARGRAMEAGADEFLEKPLLMKELVGRVRMLLSRREQARLTGRAPAALNGTVGDLGLVDLFSSLEGWQKSAIVVCEDEAKVARVWVREGQVIDAELETLTGDAAFYRLLSWESGVFRVEFGPVERPGRIRAGTQALLLEAMRRMDEAGKLAEVLPPTIVLQVDIAALAQRLADLPDEVNGILRLVDGRRSLRDIVSASPLDDLSTLAVVQRLMGDHVLRRTGKPGGARGKPSLSEWLQPTPAAAAAAPADAAELLLPDDPPLVQEGEAPELPPARPAAAAAAEPSRGVPLGRYTPARGTQRDRAQREGDAHANGMALRLTDMLDLPASPDATRGDAGSSRRRPGEGAPQPGADKPRVRWSEIGETPQPRGAAGPANALDPKQFEASPRRSRAPETAAAAPAAVPAAPPQPGARRRTLPWIGLAVAVAAGTAALFVRRGPIASPPPGTGSVPPAAAAVAAPPAAAPDAAPASVLDRPPGAAPRSPEEFARALASGQALLKKGRYRAAVAELRKAVDIEPDSIPALVALGDAFLQTDQARSALPPLQKATQLDRKNGRAQLLLGTAHQTLGHKAEALKAYKRYLDLEPSGEFAGDVRSIVATLGR